MLTEIVLDKAFQDCYFLTLTPACKRHCFSVLITKKRHKAGVPKSGRDSFELMKKAGLLSAPLSENLQKMVGLRNIAVHDYQTLNLEIVKHVVENKLHEFTDFIEEVKGL